MTMLKRSVRSFLLSVFLSPLFLGTSFAHGGEDHGDKKVVAPTNQMNVKLAEADAIELLLKYPTPKPAEEVTLLIILTDVKTNAPVAGANVSLAISRDGAGPQPDAASSVVGVASRSIETIASPTDTPGIYEAELTFPDLGEYNLALRLRGQDLAVDVEINGIVVPGADVTAEGVGTPTRKRLPLAIGAVLLYILAAAMSYLFWIHPRRNGRPIEWEPVYTTAKEYDR